MFTARVLLYKSMDYYAMVSNYSTSIVFEIMSIRCYLIIALTSCLLHSPFDGWVFALYCTIAVLDKGHWPSRAQSSALYH